MKYRASPGSSLLTLVCLLSPLLVFATQLEPYTGAADKEFILADLKGHTHSLSNYKGKVVLVNFWASWCRPCVEEMPDLTRLKKLLADQPFEILALNTGESKYKVKHFVKRINFDLPVLLDSSSKIFNNWDIKILPTSFLIDANGHVRYRIPGNPGWDDEQTISAIKKLINETVNPD